MAGIASSLWRRLKTLKSPLWIYLLVALLVRLWLIVHTQGVIAGDEALVGIQAEHILHGERPIYYYAQPYLGSLQAYLIAIIFFFTGPAIWAMRLEPILISFVIVAITWRFSAALADAAHLSAPAKRLFMAIATLVAAFAPLYDVVEEMRVTGGYVEAFAIMLWLLYAAFRLTRRWREQATTREMALRWSGLGLLIGLGLWIDPLVVYAYLAVALWVGGFIFLELAKRRTQGGASSQLALLKQTLLCGFALPAALIGFAPGLVWGAQNHWANITYLYHNSASTSSGRLHTIASVSQLYASCLAPRVLGGALPTQPDVTLADPHIVTLGLGVVGASLATCIACSGLSFFPSMSSHTALAQMWQLTALPLLFLASTSVIFCGSSIATAALVSGCGPWDLAGRYAVPMVVALPFIVAAACCLPLLLLQDRQRPSGQPYVQGDANGKTPPHHTEAKPAVLLAIQAGVIALLACYFLAQSVAYAQASPQYTFQATGCVAEYPTNVMPLISYMQRENIHDVWAVGWVADPITFETNGAILATQPDGRIPANSIALGHADHTSMLALAAHTDAHPAFLQNLDEQHVIYHIERFYSAPGVDILLITPVNRTISPSDPAFAGLFQHVFGGCVKNNEKP
jgi:hypothetical protein